MDIKAFLQSSYKKENFLKFIYETFYGFEENDTDFETPITQTELKHIEKYKFLGSCELDDGKDIGFFEVVTTKNTDIENNRVSLGTVLKNKASAELLDGALAVFYNPHNPDVFRLSFIKFSYDDNNKEQVSNLKRYTYVLGKNIPIKTAYTQLKDLRYPRLDDLEVAFSVEKISKEFFTKYKELYHKLVEDITVVNQAKITQEEQDILDDKKTVSFYIKKLLGRIVFLYFVQKKGWLDDNRRFISQLYDTHILENPSIDFYDEIMETLFFNALNTKREDDKITLGNKSYTIPYLNGGLFEADELDKKNLTIPNKDFKQILELFDSYNFTVIEDTPHDSEIAIDPEMLGKVFEDLLEDRKEKGAFYTPREIVHYMCQHSIINYLCNNFKDQEAIKDLVSHQITDNPYIRKNAKDIQNKLFDIKVLDPAIGSGAYPMGMLHEIVQVLSNLDKTANIAELKRKVIEDSIYGVDIEHSAVEIAKLRFWLSIVVDEDSPQPLPNLKYKIMVGNSLLETINGYDPLKKHGNTTEIKLLKDKLHRYFHTTNNQEKEQINEEIQRNIDTLLQSVINDIDIHPKFEMSKKEQKEYDENLARYSLIKEVLEEYRTYGYTTKLFLYKVYFKEVLDEGGFDVVIGNPPYVRQEKIKELKALKEIQEYKSYNGTADLYIYFFEKGYNLLKNGGVLSYITSNKYTRAKYGKNFREFILKNSSILEYIDFNAIKVFESATVDTSILTFTKPHKKDEFYYTKVQDDYKKGTPLQEYIQKNHIIYSMKDLSSDSFSFLDKDELTIKKKIEEVGIPLKEWDVSIYRGIVTGDNKGLVLNNKNDIEIFKKVDINNSYIKKYIFGKDINKYEYNTNKYLISIPKNTRINGEFLKILRKRDNEYNNSISNRKEKGKYWYDLRGCSFYDLFEKTIIIWSDITNIPSFAITNGDVQVDTSAYFMHINDCNLLSKFVLSILNSKIAYFYMKITASNLGSKALRWKKLFVEQIPIPKIPKIKQKPFEILVDYIIFTKKQKDMEDKAKLFEAVIDSMVYDLYFEDEMKKSDCFITDEVEKVLKDMATTPTSESFEELYKIFKTNQTIQRGLIYKRVVKVVKTINGV